MRLWDTDSGKLLHTFEGHTRDVTAIAFSPDGQQCQPEKNTSLDKRELLVMGVNGKGVIIRQEDLRPTTKKKPRTQERKTSKPRLSPGEKTAIVETPDSSTKAKSSSLNPILLADIWRIFILYDRSATKAQKQFIFFRELILILSVAATALAVIESVIESEKASVIKSFFSSGFPQFFLDHILHYLVIITPITVSILLVGSVKFERGFNWILLRASAETIKQEIYRYRTQVANYSDINLRDANFAQEIQTIGERLMKTQVNKAGLAEGKLKPSNSQTLLKAIKRGISEQDSDPFSPLTAEQYIDYRLIDQLVWYRKKTLILDKQWQILQWLIYVLGGVGTFLAAIKLQVWIAVSNAVAAALLSFLEFKRLDATLVGYNQTATNLENILCWWHALTPEAKADPNKIEKLVESSEKVIQVETTGWVQEMRDALGTLHEKKEPQRKNDNIGTQRAKGNKPG